MSNKLRWSKFFWSDWADDPALALCSHAAQGIWMRLLCIAAQGTPYGHVTINGKVPSIEDLAKLIRPPIKPTRLQCIIEELQARGVCQIGANLALISRRMEADWRLNGVRAKAAKARWNKKTTPDFVLQNDGFGMHLESQDSHDSHHPHESAGAGATEFRNGFSGSAAADNQGATHETENQPPDRATVVPVARGTYRH